MVSAHASSRPQRPRYAGTSCAQTPDRPVTVPPKPPKLDRSAQRNRPFRAPDTAVGIKRNARISPKKLNLIARLVRRMTVRDAVLQCGISDKKAGRISLKLLQDAIKNATAKGLNTEQLVVGAGW